MKNISIKITSIIFCAIACILFSNNAFAQSSKKAKTSFSTVDLINHYQVEIDEDGDYEVIVIDPRGQIIARPVETSRKMKGTSINFQVNSKYWKPGQYTILTQSKNGIANSQTFRIMPYGM